jgi:hypothetical protein
MQMSCHSTNNVSGNMMMANPQQQMMMMPPPMMFPGMSSKGMVSFPPGNDQQQQLIRQQLQALQLQQLHLQQMQMQQQQLQAAELLKKAMKSDEKPAAADESKNDASKDVSSYLQNLQLAQAGLFPALQAGTVLAQQQQQQDASSAAALEDSSV